VRERGRRAPREERGVAAAHRLVLGRRGEHVLEAGARLAERDARPAARVEERPNEVAAVAERVELLDGGPRGLQVAQFEGGIDDVRDGVGDRGHEPVVQARLEPVARVGQRLVEPAGVQADEGPEGRDDRVAGDRAPLLGVRPRLVPHALGLVEPVGKRQRVDREQVGRVVLGVERPAGQGVLGTFDHESARREPPGVVVGADGADQPRADVVADAELVDPLHLL
jgi:hypothetical protein